MATNILAEQINKSISMRNVVDKYNIQVNGAGFTSCPFHNENTASLRVYDQIGRGFFCFGCNKGGDVIKFVMQLFNITFPQALVRIQSDFGMQSDMDSRETREWQKRQREAIRAKKNKEAEDFKRFMIDAKRAEKLRTEIVENEENIIEWDPVKVGYVALIWLDAIRSRDRLNYEWEEVMEF